MKVDILMATYNGSKYIESQILSLSSQTYVDWRLIIHDDGSIDNTIELVKKMAIIDDRITVIDDGIKFGSAAANFMHLLRFSNAEYCMFCDQDDIWFDNKIELQLAAIQSKNNVLPQVVYSNSYVWIPNEGIKGLSTITFPKKINHFLFLNSGMQGCVAIFNRSMREILMSYKGTLAMHDHILHMSGLCLGEVHYLPVSLMLYRNHENNVTGNTATSSSNIKQIIKNNLLPVVDKKHYNATSCFYEIFSSNLEKKDKVKIQTYLKMLDMNIIKRMVSVIMSDYQLFGSNFRLLIKIIMRPYSN